MRIVTLVRREKALLPTTPTRTMITNNRSHKRDSPNLALRIAIDPIRS
jgi:hypothetical protein